MKLVIDIPEQEYTRWITDGEIDALIVRDALRNGIPLPKGHGRLIDADKLQNNISHDEREAFTKHQVWLKASIYNPDAQTIIEADTESEE